MGNTLNQWIVHICRRPEWEKARSEGQYQADSLEQQGFIHCSQPSQVLWVANHFFQNVQDLILLWLDPHLLTAELRWEPADGQLFPHIYGPINLEAVIAVQEFHPELDGSFLQLPDVGPLAENQAAAPEEAE